MLPGISAPHCTYLIFRALFVCGFWSCEEAEAEPLKMRSQNPVQPRPSFRIPFLYMSFHVPGCPPRATTGCWGKDVFIFFFPAWLVIYERSSVFCLNAKLLGKDYRFASPDATVGYWQAARSFSRKEPSLTHSMSADLPLMPFPSIWFVRKERLCVHATVQSYLCV